MNQEPYKYYIGWDVGGAHLKAALMNNDGTLLEVLQVPCALWKGLALLAQSIEDITRLLSSKYGFQGDLCHAVTMTGELVDLFDNRQMGVIEISKLVSIELEGDVLFYRAAKGEQSLIPFEKVYESWEAIASANWHASAALVAEQAKTGLLVDIGSTTTDMILFRVGHVSCVGFSDAARMQCNELIYSGVVRTPLMAIANTIAWGAGESNVAAEHFATMADVYRLTGDLEPEDDMADTADGHDKSLEASARRIARMIGHDVEDATMGQWLELAIAFKSIQKQRLADAIEGHLQLLTTLEPTLATLKLIGAGVGSFLLEEIVGEMNIKMPHHRITYQHATDVLGQHTFSASNASLSQWAGHCLPAVAVGYFAHQAMGVTQ